MTLNEKIAVMEAARAGKKIQARRRVGNVLDKGYLNVKYSDWADTEPIWNFQFYDYRVKPEPRKLYSVATRAGRVRATSSLDRAKELANLFGVPFSSIVEYVEVPK